MSKHNEIPNRIDGESNSSLDESKTTFEGASPLVHPQPSSGGPSCVLEELGGASPQVQKLIDIYSSMNINDRGQFIGALIGEYSLLKEMGLWFDSYSFSSLFKSEFEKGSREKVLIDLAEIDINSKDKPIEVFWIMSPFNEQNVLFYQIMKSKDYSIKETECTLDYDDEQCILNNNVELGSDYPLAYQFINFDDAKRNGKIIKGTHGGNKIKMKGLLAHI